MQRFGKIIATMFMAFVFVSMATAAASAATVTPNAVTHSVTPNGVQSCNSSTKNWAATYPSYGDWLAGAGATHCIGDKGTWNVPYNVTQVFCAGNNHGEFWWLNLDTGAYGSASFSSDRSYSVAADNSVIGANPYGSSIYVYKVRIDGWTGSAGC